MSWPNSITINLSVVCFFICLYFIFYCALLLFCAQAWHGKILSSRNDPIFFCSLHWRNLSLYNKITTTHFKLIRFWWKNVIKFRGKVYSNFFKFVQQLFFLSALLQAGIWMKRNLFPNWATRTQIPPPHQLAQTVTLETIALVSGSSSRNNTIQKKRMKLSLSYCMEL